MLIINRFLIVFLDKIRYNVFYICSIILKGDVMKAAGIIAEYNPFHNGHKYHIEEVRRNTGADCIIVVMSGDFTQRGTPAIIDKYARAQMALSNGADVVIELPNCYASASAEFFADGAIALLDSLGIVDDVCFGSECGDIEKLRPVAELLADEPDEFKAFLQNELSLGASYPLARNRALLHTVPSFAENENIIGTPNNILGIEYMKSIIRRNSQIKPSTIQRTGADYHSFRYGEDIYPSSLSLRTALASNNTLDFMRNQVPESVFDILNKQYHVTYPIFPNDFSDMLSYKLLSESNIGYSSYMDVNHDLSDRILNHIYQTHSYEELCDKLKTKNLTYARASRLLCHILLNQKTQDILDYRNNGTVFYAHILGFKDDGRRILKEIKENATVPIITRCQEYKMLTDPLARKQFEGDLFASHIYEIIVGNKFGNSMRNEFERQIVKM